MAFCPNCGKSVGEQASKCSSCGKPLEGAAPPKQRFKGTMLMTPTAVPAGVQLPPPKPSPEPTPPAAQPAHMPQAAPPPAAGQAPKRPMKQTMLGTGAEGAPISGAPPAQASAPPAQASAPPAAAASAAAASSPAPAAEQPPEQAARPSTDALADTAPQPATADDDSQRFLVGDPMAPATPPEGSAQRRDPNYVPFAERGDSSSGMLVTVALIGIAAIAAVGYFAARTMGLL